MFQLVLGFSIVFIYFSVGFLIFCRLYINIYIYICFFFFWGGGSRSIFAIDTLSGRPFWD